MAVFLVGSGGGGAVGVPLTLGGCARTGGLVVTADCVDDDGGGEVEDDLIFEDLFVVVVVVVADDNAAALLWRVWIRAR